MPRIPITHTDDTGVYLEENGDRVLYIRGAPVLNFGTRTDYPFAQGTALKSDGVSLVAEPLYQKWSLRIPAASGLDTDAYGTGLAGCGAALDITSTEADAAFCKVFDTSAATKYRAIGAASVDDFVQWQVLPNNTQDNDAVYFGSAVPWCSMRLDMEATVSTYGGDALTWEFWNGTTWAALTLARDNSGVAVKTGARAFGQDGGVFFAPPGTWASTTVDGQAGFWVRARVSTVANLLILGKLNAHRQYMTAPADAFIAPATGTITDIAICDEAGVVHTTNDIELDLINFTAGNQSGVLTFAQDKRRDSWDMLAMGVSKGDVLGVVITQEDGAAEIGPFTLELQVTLL